MSRQGIRHQQAFTTRWAGRDMTLAEIAKDSGISLATISMRYKAGKRGGDLTMPVRKSTPRAPAIEIYSRGLL